MEATVLEDRVAFVTGGASGLGRATCVALAEVGVTVIVADINELGAAETVERITAKGGSAKAIRFDVTLDDDRREAIRNAIDEYGDRFDILINVAGIDRPGYLHDVGLREFRMVNLVNYEGPVFLTSEFIKGMLKRTTGLAPAEIVNIISLSAITVGSGAVAYNSSKAAFAKATEIMQRDTLEHNYPCRIQGIMPAAMDTPMMEQWHIPTERMMDPAFMAAEIVHALRRPAGCYAQNLVMTPSTEPEWPR